MNRREDNPSRFNGNRREDNPSRFNSNRREDTPPLFSRTIKAGKRTYYIDINSTRQGDPYVTLKEQFRSHGEGESSVKKQKLFLYKEDISKFSKAFDEVIQHLKEELLPDYNFDEQPR